MRCVVMNHHLEVPQDDDTTRIYPAGWTGMVPLAVAAAVVACGAGRYDEDREAMLVEAGELEIPPTVPSDEPSEHGLSAEQLVQLASGAFGLVIGADGATLVALEEFLAGDAEDVAARIAAFGLEVVFLAPAVVIDRAPEVWGATEGGEVPIADAAAPKVDQPPDVVAQASEKAPAEDAPAPAVDEPADMVAPGEAPGAASVTASAEDVPGKIPVADAVVTESDEPADVAAQAVEASTEELPAPAVDEPASTKPAKSSRAKG